MRANGTRRTPRRRCRRPQGRSPSGSPGDGRLAAVVVRITLLAGVLGRSSAADRRADAGPVRPRARLPGPRRHPRATDVLRPAGAWYLPGPDGARRCSSPTGTAATAASGHPWPAHSPTEGSPYCSSTTGATAATRAARRRRAGPRRAGGPRVPGRAGRGPPVRLVYFGESLGAAVRHRLAAEHPPAGLVLRSPFLDLAAVRGALPVPAGARCCCATATRWPSRSRRVEVPTAVVDGERDSIVPPEQSRAVADAAAGAAAPGRGAARRPQRPRPAGRDALVSAFVELARRPTDRFRTA